MANSANKSNVTVIVKHMCNSKDLDVCMQQDAFAMF